MLKLALGVLVSTMLTGCATIVSRSTEPIAIDSDPTAASLLVTCPNRSPQEAVTPVVLRIERRAGDCMVEVRKPGYVARFVSIERGMSPRIMGNLVPSALGLLYATVADDNLSGGAALLSGGLLTGAGFLVDWITGRTADHDPKRVTVNLELEMPPPSRP